MKSFLVCVGAMLSLWPRALQAEWSSESLESDGSYDDDDFGGQYEPYANAAYAPQPPQLPQAGYGQPQPGYGHPQPVYPESAGYGPSRIHLRPRTSAIQSPQLGYGHQGAAPTGYGPHAAAPTYGAAPDRYGPPHRPHPQQKHPRCSSQCHERDPWAQQNCLRLCCHEICRHSYACKAQCFAKYSLTDVEGSHKEPAAPHPAATTAPAKVTPKPDGPGQPQAPQQPMGPQQPQQPQPPQPPQAASPPPPPQYPNAKTLFRGYEYRSYACAQKDAASLACQRSAKEGGDFDCALPASSQQGYADSCSRGGETLACAYEHGAYWCSEYVAAGFYFALPKSPLGPRFQPPPHASHLGQAGHPLGGYGGEEAGGYFGRHPLRFERQAQLRSYH